jgi:hypothetical protein
MKCCNHPDLEAQSMCVSCGRPFCTNCVTEIDGKRYCGECKTKVTTGISLPKKPCKEATTSLVTAIIGFFIFGIILGPIAISNANKAKKLMAADSSLTGGGKATAGLVIGVIDVVGWAFFIISSFLWC